MSKHVCSPRRMRRERRLMNGSGIRGSRVTCFWDRRSGEPWGQSFVELCWCEAKQRIDVILFLVSLTVLAVVVAVVVRCCCFVAVAAVAVVVVGVVVVVVVVVVDVAGMQGASSP